ncbi:MAG: response regulator transcription factor [Pedobacter sp.]|nr:MAG: response regulator transcription factor [Pedobacter sp.]
MLNLLHRGFNGPQIAEKLFISHFTVETHRKNLMQKLDANTTQLLLKNAKAFNLV